MSVLLKVEKFTTFTIESGVKCKAIACKINGEDSFFVPDGWQEELSARSIPFEAVEESKVELPTLNFNEDD